MEKMHHYFVTHLLEWNKLHNHRKMPWKGEKDPYKIWLSEIILQQTRVDQGLDYYNRFIKYFPVIKQLADAEETTVFKLWEGLGYYTRCKNLIATAKFVSANFNGKFPDTYESILSLKGIGPYTAAAISSFAFNLPHAVVDGNVYRVLSRFFGIETAVDTTKGKQLYSTLANELLSKKFPGIYNQAIMDFGATICKPQLPICIECALKKNCSAFKSNRVNLLPVKEKFITQKTRWLNYLVLDYKGCIYIRKRGSKDIWENLYEFISIESNEALQIEKITKLQSLKSILKGQKIEIIQVSGIYKQKLTHQTIYGQFIKATLSKPLQQSNFKMVSTQDLMQLPFPKFITTYLKDKNVSLNLF